MSEFRVGDYTYRTRAKLDARQQFHIARRIMPMIMQVVEMRDVLARAAEAPDGTTLTEEAANMRMLETLVQVVSPILAKLADEECDYVLDRCLSVVQRMQGGNGTQVWVDVWNARAKRMMFEDITMPDMMLMAREVIVENLQGFFAISNPAENAFAMGTPGPTSIGSISPMAKAS